MSTPTRAQVRERIARLSRRRPVMSGRASMRLGVCYVVADVAFYVWRIERDHIVVRNRHGSYILAPHPHESNRWRRVQTA